MKKDILFILTSLVITTSWCQAQNPTLWGTTINGGAYNRGTIFSYDITTGVETHVHDFGNGTDGAIPIYSLLLASNGLLYGLTNEGGKYNLGTIFSYNISTGKETDLHDFGNGTDGATPYGSLIQASDGLLYGLTFAGGMDFDFGTIFSYDISTGKETDLHNFTEGPFGENPFGTLFQANNGLLYGMTSEGGINGDNVGGTLFSYNILTGTEIDLHDFGTDTDGNQPQGSLIQAENGLLYGLTALGGALQGGMIFSYNISTGIEANLHSFGSSTDGVLPTSTPIQASNGLLYAAAVYGGITGDGTIFSYDISTGTETSLHDFGNGTDGQSPDGVSFQASNGLLYGMTYGGGVNNLGTIFTFDISSDTEIDIYDFGSGTDGANPGADLIEIDPPSGINQLNNMVNIHLYPNPASSIIHLSLKMQRDQNVNVSLCNALGQQVWEENLEKYKQMETSIPVNNLADGVYLLKVYCDGKLQEEKVVVER